MGKECQIPKYKTKKLIKHAPLRPYVHTELDTTVYVKSTTPFMSAVKRIEKMLYKFEEIPNKRGELVRRGNASGKCKFITVRGMGKSIDKVVNLGLHFKYEEKCTVDIFTKSVGVLDEFVKNKEEMEPTKEEQEEKEVEEDESVLRKRNVGAIEVRIYI